MTALATDSIQAADANHVILPHKFIDGRGLHSFTLVELKLSNSHTRS
jgi:hypothetical protein